MERNISRRGIYLYKFRKDHCIRREFGPEDGDKTLPKRLQQGKGGGGETFNITSTFTQDKKWPVGGFFQPDRNLPLSKMATKCVPKR